MAREKGCYLRKAHQGGEKQSRGARIDRPEGLNAFRHQKKRGREGYESFGGESQKEPMIVDVGPGIDKENQKSIEKKKNRHAFP